MQYNFTENCSCSLMFFSVQHSHHQTTNPFNNFNRHILLLKEFVIRKTQTQKKQKQKKTKTQKQLHTNQQIMCHKLFSMYVFIFVIFSSLNIFISKIASTRSLLLNPPLSIAVYTCKLLCMSVCMCLCVFFFLALAILFRIVLLAFLPKFIEMYHICVCVYVLSERIEFMT